MKRIEIAYEGKLKLLAKLVARFERQTKALDKAKAKAEKLGVAGWDNDTHREWLSNVETIDDGFFNCRLKNKEDIEKNGAWFNLFKAQDDIAETTESLNKCRADLEKMEAELKATDLTEDDTKIEISDERKAKLMQESFFEEIKEWLEDGIILEGRYFGYTPNGKRFSIYRNSYGYTKRSLHCFTLYIDGKCIFTSGLFWRAYAIVKNS